MKHSYSHIAIMKLSHDHRMVAYTMDITGDETFNAYIKNLETLSVVQVWQALLIWYE
jgi:protease II